MPDKETGTSSRLLLNRFRISRFSKLGKIRFYLYAPLIAMKYVIQPVPKVLQKRFSSLAQQLWGQLLSWFIRLGVQTLQPLIVIFRSNFVFQYWGMGMYINLFIGLYVTPLDLWVLTFFLQLSLKCLNL